MGTPSFLWRKAKNVHAWTLGNQWVKQQKPTQKRTPAWEIMSFRAKKIFLIVFSTWLSQILGYCRFSDSRYTEANFQGFGLGVFAL